MRCWRCCRPSLRLDRAVDRYPFITRCERVGTVLSDAYHTQPESVQWTRRPADPFRQTTTFTPAPSSPAIAGVVVSGPHIIAPHTAGLTGTIPSTRHQGQHFAHQQATSASQEHPAVQRLAAGLPKSGDTPSRHPAPALAHLLRSVPASREQPGRARHIATFLGSSGPKTSYGN